MDAINKISVTRDYSSITASQIHRFLVSAREIECALVQGMARAANLLVITKKREAGNQIIGISDITEVLLNAQKKVLETPEAKKLPLNWPFTTANQFYLDMIELLAGKQGDQELSLQVIQKGYETEVSLHFRTS